MTIIDPTNPAHPAHRNHLISTRGRTAQRVWHPSVPILESVQNELLSICQSHAKERCGFISSRWDVHQIENVHQAPYHNFFMDETEVIEAIDQIYNVQEEHIIAIWHTHPNDVVWPSPRDLAGWPRKELNWRYLIVTNKEVLEWQLEK